MRIAGAFIVWTAFIFICGAAVYAGSEKDAITPGTEEQRGFINDNVNDLGDRGYFIYHAVGTQDAVKSQSINMADEMLERKDTFTPEHYMFHLKEGGYHDFDAVQEYLYNALPLFFQDGAKDISYMKGKETDTVPETGKDKVYTGETGISEVRNDPVLVNTED